MKPFVPSHWHMLDGRDTVAVASESNPGRQYFVGLRSLKCSCPWAARGHICKHARWVHSNKARILAERRGGLFASMPTGSC